MNKKSTLLISVLLVVIGLTIQSCSEENPTGPITFQVALNGTNEKPTTTNSIATGAFVGILQEDTRVMSYTVTYTGLTPTMGHLHRIDTTKTDGTGPAEITFPSLASPIIGSTPELTPLQIYRLKNSQYYVNLHSKQFPDGEIRGDLKTKLWASLLAIPFVLFVSILIMRMFKLSEVETKWAFLSCWRSRVAGAEAWQKWCSNKSLNRFYSKAYAW